MRRIRFKIIFFLISISTLFLSSIFLIFPRNSNNVKEGKTEINSDKLSKINSNIISKSVLIGYSNADNLTIFSAYQHSSDEVLVILSSYGYLNRRVYCRLFDKDERQLYYHASVVFPEYTVKCKTGGMKNIRLVAISLNKDDRLVNLQDISIVKEKQPAVFGVCLAPLFGNSPKVLNLIEFIEYYKLQGASKFFIYKYDTNHRVDKLLQMYNESLLEIIHIKNNTKCMNRHRCRHEMQLQDCVIRNRFKVKWLATVDLDERIMNINPKKAIIDLLREHEDDEKVGELRFRCQWTLRYAQLPTDETIDISHLPMLKWHNTSSVAPQNHTTKSVVRPEMVDSMGVHGVQKFINGYGVRLIEPGVSVVRHYRFVEGWSFFLKEAESFGKFSHFEISGDLKRRLLVNAGNLIKMMNK